MDQTSGKLPLIIFSLTFLVGLISIIISFQAQKILPEIFQVQEPYPSGGDDVGWGNCTVKGGCNGCKDNNNWFACKCGDQSYDDPACCDGDGNQSPQPPSSSSPGPSRSPSPSPSASPVGNFSCVSLSGQPASPQPGIEVTFTCTAQTTQDLIVDHYKFRINNGTPIIIYPNPTGAKTTTYRYTIPADATTISVQCQVCTRDGQNITCTSWGQAN